MLRSLCGSMQSDQSFRFRMTVYLVEQRRLRSVRASVKPVMMYEVNVMAIRKNRFG